MKHFHSFLALSFLAALAISCAPKDNTLTKAEQADGWQLLFNGQDLTGWRSFNKPELIGGWSVVDGCIRAAGDGSDGSGYIVTDRKYSNFILKWDWKLTHGGNSGMIYHVVENPVFDVPYVTGPEYQLIDNEGWEEVNAPNKLEEWQKLGVDYAMHLPDYSVMKVNPQGEWNTSQIVFDNGHVEHWLNGVKVIEYERGSAAFRKAVAESKYATWGNDRDGKPQPWGEVPVGRLHIQDHSDSTAYFCNLKVKEL